MIKMNGRRVVRTGMMMLRMAAALAGATARADVLQFHLSLPDG